MKIKERRKKELNNRCVDKEDIAVYYGTGEEIIILTGDTHNDSEITDKQAMQLRDILNELYPKEER